ncbi:hypothetical protein LXL04_019673 [Taraxacum kok-saghyz]
MKKEHVVLMLCTIVIAIPLVQSAFEGPNEVKEWFEELPVKKQKVTRLHFYLHDVFSGPTQSAYPVFTSNITSTSISNFGLGVIFDDLLTVEPDIGSMTIGRGQGLATSAAFEETRFLQVINFVFTQGKLNGSTLQVLGTNPLHNQVRELSIVGGTGFFRLARGTATLSNYTTSSSIRQYDILVLHYESKRCQNCYI